MSSSTFRRLHSVVTALSCRHTGISMPSWSFYRCHSVVVIPGLSSHCSHDLIVTPPSSISYYHGLLSSHSHAVVFTPSSSSSSFRHAAIIMSEMRMTDLHMFMLSEVLPDENVSNLVMCFLFANGH